MSRRRHTADTVLRSVGWALERVLKTLVFCPECGGRGEGIHRSTCEVARALRFYREWCDLGNNALSAPTPRAVAEEPLVTPAWVAGLQIR